MKIAKILNNSAVLIINENNKEQVVMGSGLGYQKKVGDSIEKSQIEKLFALEDQRLIPQLSELLSRIPDDVMRTCDSIIDMAKNELGDLQDSIYINLTDHCFFAIDRIKNSVNIKNGLLWEIRNIYPKEYKVGKIAVDIIKEQLQVELPEDEVGFIALHFVNAKLNSEMPEVFHITRVMQEILQIVKYYMRIDYNESSLSYTRFITHLKFFAQRMLSNVFCKDDDIQMHETIMNKFPESWSCSEVIEKFLINNYQRPLSGEEKMFLTIHIEQVKKESKEMQ